MTVSLPTVLHHQKAKSIGLIFTRLFKMSVGLENVGTNTPIPPLQSQGAETANPTSKSMPLSVNVKISKHDPTLASPASSSSTSRMLQPEFPSVINSARLSSSATTNQETMPSSQSSGTSDVQKEKVVHVHSLRTHLSSSPSQDENALLASRRVDPTTIRQVYYFDTLSFVKKLESKGFSREQAEGFAECLVEIINTTLDHQGRHMVTKPQQEIAVQQLLSEIVSVKKDMTLLQKSEFSSLKTETEKMSIELSQIQSHMNDEILKLKGQFTLDINLERGRAIEAHAENEKKLQQLHNKIETEIANLKTIFEIYRNDVFKYAGGTVIAVGSLILGVLRLWQ
ncbi:Mitochondrial calcium uniporter regulator 1 [Bulinus truncatus]|nr:Mitochondrial calcium uniporter regulator 1 [Bulinus truncatus]